MKSIFAALFIIISLLSVPAQAVVQYTITDLGTDRGVYGLNNQGQVVGDSPSGPFKYFNGTVQLLSLPPVSSAACINNNGQIAGSTYIDYSCYAFLYDAGTGHDLGNLGAAYSSAYAINDAGQVVGFSTTGDGHQHAFLYSEGHMQDLGTLPGDQVSQATGINNKGQVAGISYDPTPDGHYHAFRYSSGVKEPLGTLGGLDSYAYGINNIGQVVGAATTLDSEQHAFLYSEGAMHDLGTLGGSKSSAYSINQSGQIVGCADTSDGIQHAFLYCDGVMQDLNTLIDPSSGWILTGVNAINDRGQIIGFGANATHDGGETWGENFLLTPIPEPSAFVLLVLGLISSIAFARRRAM